MKKVFAIILVLVLAVFLAACGDNDPQSTPAPESDPAAEPVSESAPEATPEPASDTSDGNVTTPKNIAEFTEAINALRVAFYQAVAEVEEAFYADVSQESMDAVLSATLDIRDYHNNKALQILHSFNDLLREQYHADEITGDEEDRYYDESNAMYDDFYDEIYEAWDRVVDAAFIALEEN